MIDTPIAIARCRRCKQLVLRATDGGVLAAADTTPLGLDGYRQALLAGRAAYDVLTAATGRTYLRRRVWRPRLTFPWPVVAAHNCGASPMDADDLQGPEKGPERPCEALEQCPRPRYSLFALPGAQEAAQEPSGPVSCEGCDPAPF